MAALNYSDPPLKTLEELTEIYNPKMFLVIDEVLATKKTYITVMQDLLDIMKNGFEYREVRSMPLHFKFHREDKVLNVLELRHLYSNLILWGAFITIDKVELLDPSYIYDFSKFGINTLINYIDLRILPLTNDIDFATKNLLVDDISYNITATVHAFSMLFGVSISIHNIISLEKRIPEVGYLMHEDIPETLSPSDIEDVLSQRTKRMIELITTDTEDNDLKPLFLSGKNISEGQFREFIIKIGLKSDINGHTIPAIINDNFLVTGLTKPSNLYINANGGRKALILSKLSMGIPGAFSKKLNQVTTAASILQHNSDICDSIHTVDYVIRDDTFLKLLHGRYYYDQYGTLQNLDYYSDKELIGKIVRFKSPATCSGEDGICRYCYGDLYQINQDMESVGALAATKIAEPTGQSILSAKHEQNTQSSEIAFGEDFNDLFEVNSSEVTIRDDSLVDGDFSLVLNNVQVEESDDSEFYFVESFDVVDEMGTTVYHVAEEHESKMYLSEELLAIWKRVKDKHLPIGLDNFDDSGNLFSIEIKNKELTDTISTLQKLLNNTNHLGARTVSEICQLFADSLIRFGIKYDLVHAECIIRAILRKKSDECEFPDWSRAGDPYDYQIMTLNNALLKNPSALVSMSYGYLRKQLISPELYGKTAPSHLDPLFVSCLADYVD